MIRRAAVEGPGRGPLIVIGWLASLGVVVGVGVLGGWEASTSRATPVVAAPSEVADDSAEPVLDVIELVEPAAAGVIVTTPDLVIRGYLRVRGGPLRILLESSGGKAMLTRTVSPAPWFLVNLPLSNPRPGGEKTIQVIAYNLDAIPTMSSGGGSSSARSPSERSARTA